MAKYQMRVLLATPDVMDDEDIMFQIDLMDKKELHKVEKAFINGLNSLVKLTEEELKSGKKAFEGTDPQLVTFTVDITKEGGVDFGGYMFRWPNQTKEAREFLKGMIDGLMKETGHFQKKQRVKKR